MLNYDMLSALCGHRVATKFRKHAESRVLKLTRKLHDKYTHVRQRMRPDYKKGRIAYHFVDMKTEQ